MAERISKYEKRVQDNCAEFLSVHPGELVNEFSREGCDSCGSDLAGERHQMTGLRSVGPDADVFEGVMCTDCVLYHANGDLPEDDGGPDFEGVDTQTVLYETDAAACGFGVEVPAWIDNQITAADIAAICEGGCASGAYMPAVTYSDALETMNDHGDQVLQYLEDTLGDIPTPKEDFSWAGLACFYLSSAVELWASGVSEELADAIRG